MSSLRRGASSPLSACFHPSAAVNADPPPSSLPQDPAISGDPSNTSATCLYHTHVGVFSLSWTHHSFLRRTLLLHFYYCHSKNCYIHTPNCFRHSFPLTFKLDVKPLTFWRKKGSKKISLKPEIRVVWDLTRARFGSGPDPDSGFYVAVVVSGELCFLVGNSLGEGIKQRPKRQILVSRRESLFGDRVYSTKTRFKGKTREISIAIRVHNHEANLRISVDNKRVLQIKRLQWKFRGNSKIEIDGVAIQISWDVYEWLFGNRDKTKPVKGHAVFLLRYENPEVDRVRNDFVSRQQKNTLTTSFWKSPCGGSVAEWETCTEEEEMGFGDKSWFSLLLYAWRK